MDAPINTTAAREGIRRLGLVALLTVIWVLTVALVNLGPEFVWGQNPAATWAAVVVNVLVGISVIVAYARLIRSQDELQRKIALDALAVTFGLSLVLGFGYVLARGTGVITHDLELVWFLTGSAVLFTVASLGSWLRYR